MEEGGGYWQLGQIRKAKKRGKEGCENKVQQGRKRQQGEGVKEERKWECLTDERGNNCKREKVCRFKGHIKVGIREGVMLTNNGNNRVNPRGPSVCVF